MKEFYNIVCKKENVQKILTFATVPLNDGSKPSKVASLQVLNQIITQHIERLKKKESSKNSDKDTNNDDDDDMIVQQNSDDENADDLEATGGGAAGAANALQAQTALLVEIIKEKVDGIADILRPDHDGAKIQGSVTDTQYVPLGQQRLLTVELVNKVLQLRNDGLYQHLSQNGSKIFANIVALVKQYPWNNFLQLKVMNIFEEVLDNCENIQFRKDFLQSSGIGPALVQMAETASFKMESDRNIRNGYMALVVSISNKLQKKYEGSTAAERAEDITIVDYLDSVGEEWRAFVDDELKKSLEKNNKTLGGSTTRNTIDEDEEKEDSNYDVQMEKIMARFTNFNSILSQGSSADDDDDDDDDDDTQDDKEDKFDDDDDDKSKRPSTPALSQCDSDAGIKVQKWDFKEPEPLEKEYIDNNFWRVEPAQTEIDVDSLLAELEA